MKRIISVLAALAVTLGVVSHGADLSHLGMRLSVDAAMPGDYTTGDGYTSLSIFGNGPGFTIGAIYKVDLTDHLFVEPGVSLYYSAYSINKRLLNDMITEEMLPDGAEASFKITHRSLRKSGLRVPVMVGYTFPMNDDFTFRVFTGPMLDVGFSADYYFSMKVNGYDVHKASSAYGKHRSLRCVNCFWNIGAGLTFSHNYYLGLQLDLGMCNIARKNATYKPSLHENLLQLTFGYNL